MFHKLHADIIITLKLIRDNSEIGHQELMIWVFPFL